MTNYQKRITKLVWAGNVYLVGAPLAVWYFSLPPVAWFCSQGHSSRPLPSQAGDTFFSVVKELRGVT